MVQLERQKHKQGKVEMLKGIPQSPSLVCSQHQTDLEEQQNH